jgi:hypothetical protein
MLAIKQKKNNANNQFKNDAIHVCTRLPAVIVVIVTVFKIEYFIDQILRFFPHIPRQSTSKSKIFENL